MTTVRFMFYHQAHRATVRLRNSTTKTILDFCKSERPKTLVTAKLEIGRHESESFLWQTRHTNRMLQGNLLMNLVPLIGSKLSSESSKFEQSLRSNVKSKL